MERLTIIIPFLNEGEEIANTLHSIRETAGDAVDILLINDNSDSFGIFDYEKIANSFEAKYIWNETRMGVAKSRDIGVDNITTKYFLIIDGHMRFYNNNWWTAIINELVKDERALYCCKCKPLDSELNIMQNKPSFGAYIEFDQTDNREHVLSAQWIRKDASKDISIVKIPCVLGASYAASKDYWLYLKGLSGLHMYGSDEPYISLKVWLEGGSCYLIKNIGIGHIFRSRFPYYINKTEILYNKYLIAKVLLPEEYMNLITGRLNNDYKLFNEEIEEIISSNQMEITNLKNYYQSISNRNFEEFISFNNSAKNNLI